MKVRELTIHKKDDGYNFLRSHVFAHDYDLPGDPSQGYSIINPTYVDKIESIQHHVPVACLDFTQGVTEEALMAILIDRLDSKSLAADSLDEATQWGGMAGTLSDVLEGLMQLQPAVREEASLS